MTVTRSLKEFNVHFKAMMRKNWLLTIRSIKGTIGQVVAPIFFMLLLGLIQKLPPAEEKNDLTSFTIPRCTSSDEINRCFSLVYSIELSNSPIVDSDIDLIMTQVATDNGLTFTSVFDPTSTSAKDQVVKVPYSELDNFLIQYPNTTQAAVIFNYNNSYYGGNFGNQINIPYNILINSTIESSFSDINVDTTYLFSSIQKSVDAGIISILAKNNGINGIKAVINALFKLFPQTNLASFDAFSTLGNLFLYCALMFNFTVILYQIVNEKALNLRQGMRMIGLSDLAYWLSWFLTNLIFLIIYIIILVIIGYGFQFPFFARTNFAVHFLTFFTFGLSMIPLAYLLSMFLTTTKQAINIGMLIFVVGTILQIIFSIDFALQYLYQKQKELRWILQFYPPFNFSKLMADINNKANSAAVESLPPGNNSLLFNWDDLYNERAYAGFTVPEPVHSIGYQMMDFAIFVFLSWYFYNVLPSEKGLKPWFIFTRDYWRIGKVTEENKIKSPEEKEIGDDDVKLEIKKAFEEENADLRILNLHKKYHRFFGLKLVQYAVRGLSLSVNKGQVFALLGHNGAGKSTTISCLTGAIKQTKGDAYIFGHSLKHSLDQVQKIIGVCPQHDVLFDELTAREHLEIYADLKGVPKNEQNQMIEDRLNDVLLLNVQHKQAGTFSGGMKRRLSVAISAIGNPKVIFLDEPTTGLDPLSRREIWGAIERLKKDRVIILTTHSMEEADILGDTIAVMAKGKLRCIGTSLHLKNKFGLGYRINLTTTPERHLELKDLVARSLPGSELIAESGGFLVYGVQTQNIGVTIPFFKFIEQHKDDPNFVIKDWGMSQTTLEEVFLRVTKESEGEHHH